MSGEEGTKLRDMDWDEVPFYFWNVATAHFDACSHCYEGSVARSRNDRASHRRMGKHKIDYGNDLMAMSNAIRRIPNVYHESYFVLSCVNPNCAAPLAVIERCGGSGSPSDMKDAHKGTRAARSIHVPFVILGQRRPVTSSLKPAKGYGTHTAQVFSERYGWKEADVYTGSKEEIQDLLSMVSSGHNSLCRYSSGSSHLNPVSRRTTRMSIDWTDAH